MTDTMTPQEAKDRLENNALEFIGNGLKDGTIPPAGLVMITVTDGVLILEVKATLDDMGDTGAAEVAAVAELEVSVSDVDSYGDDAR